MNERNVGNLTELSPNRRSSTSMLSISCNKLLNHILFYRFVVCRSLGLKLIGHFVLIFFVIIIICVSKNSFTELGIYDMLICV